MIGSPEYIAEQFEIKDIYDINRARRSLITHLEERMMTQSTILLKNDHNLLPLPHGIKIYYESNHSAMQQAVPPALSQFAELVDDMEEADVIIIQASALNDAYEDIRDEALETGKPMVLIVQMALQYTSEPGVAEVEASTQYWPQHMITRPTTVYAMTFTAMSIQKSWLTWCSDAVNPRVRPCSRSVDLPMITCCPSMNWLTISV